MIFVVLIADDGSWRPCMKNAQHLYPFGRHN
jgi:hypothetical protein